MQETLLSALRRATAPRHARIERLLALDHPFSLDHYKAVLRGFGGFLAHWEPSVRAALPAHLQPWFALRSRAGLLEQDLSVLGVARDKRDAGQAGGHGSGLARLLMQGGAAVFGSLYVMEGSVLGGRVVARQVAAQHGLEQKSGAAYFSGWGTRTGGMWQEFLGMLEHCDAAGADHAQACEAACATFDALARDCARSLDATR